MRRDFDTPFTGFSIHLAIVICEIHGRRDLPGCIGMPLRLVRLARLIPLTIYHYIRLGSKITLIRQEADQVVK